MESSGDPEQVVFGNEQHPIITTGAVTTPNPDESLSGSTVRQVTGSFQIVCGVIEIALGIVVICLPLQKFTFRYVYRYSYKYTYTEVYDFDDADDIGWGIWNGLFAIVTGFLGVYSNKPKCMVVAYMITSIIATVSSATCLTWAAVYVPKANEDPAYYANDNRSASFAMYIILCFSFAIQMVMSILGASFTCTAFSSTDIQHQPVYYYVTPPQHQQTGSMVWYCQPSAPPPQYNAVLDSVNPSNTPNGEEIKPPS